MAQQRSSVTAVNKNMEIANCRVIIGEKGSDVAQYHVTPMQVHLLRKEHFKNVGGDPITNLQVIDLDAKVKKKVDGKEVEVPMFDPAYVKELKNRTATDERNRLLQFYPSDIINKLWPGETVSGGFLKFSDLPVVAQPDTDPKQFQARRPASMLPATHAPHHGNVGRHEVQSIDQAIENLKQPTVAANKAGETKTGEVAVHIIK